MDNKLNDLDHVAQNFGALSSASRSYRSAKGEKFSLTVTRTRSDSGAYALLTMAAQSLRRMEALPATIKRGEVGTANLFAPDRILFFKGPAFVAIDKAVNAASSHEAMLALARAFADSLDQGEGDIPVLVKHLPDWETAQQDTTYAVSLPALQEMTGNQPALDAIGFEGGTEAVTATYGSSRLVLVEYTTPQMATEADARINARINELRDAGQSSPSAYRRVGNYSVFVFDAPDEQAAAQLIERVSYEQVVQWLGNNPRALERAQKLYTQTTAGIILAVIKASGLSLLLCFGIGSIFGTIIFRRRRAQQAATEAYSDAGGMVRLNIDEMTAQSDPARLLGRGNG